MRAEIEGDRLRIAGAWVGRVGFSSGEFSRVSSGTKESLLQGGIMSHEDREAAVQAMDADTLLWRQTVVLAVWVLYCRRNTALAYESVPDTMHSVLRGPAPAPFG